jgi:hypothetical protein
LRDARNFHLPNLARYRSCATVRVEKRPWQLARLLGKRMFVVNEAQYSPIRLTLHPRARTLSSE